MKALRASRLARLASASAVREDLRQALTYATIGGCAAILELACLYVLVDLAGAYYLVGASLAFLLVVTLSFSAHRRLTFRHRGGENRRRYLLFVATTASGLGWNLLLLYVLVDRLGVWYLGAAAAVKLIVLGWNFSITKYVTFRDSGSASGRQRGAVAPRSDDRIDSRSAAQPPLNPVPPS